MFTNYSIDAVSADAQLDNGGGFGSCSVDCGAAMLVFTLGEGAVMRARFNR